MTVYLKLSQIQLTQQNPSSAPPVSTALVWEVQMVVLQFPAQQGNMFSQQIQQ